MKEIFIRNYDKELIQKGYTQELSEELLEAEAEYFRQKELAEAKSKNQTSSSINEENKPFINNQSYYGDYPLFI